MDDLLREAVMRKASDLHITIGIPPVFRVNGSLICTEHSRLLSSDTDKLLRQITTKNQYKEFSDQGQLDFSYAIMGLGRFRVNAFRQRGSIAIVVRIIAENVPTLQELGHPPILKTLARKSKGMVLVTGPTGSGKSTTLAAMVDLINRESSCHIITLEDPLEYLHKHNKSIVNQREIHTDTNSFSIALRSALREDPDVILVGEMRDIETIATALTAAETGHLVLATLHTSDAAQTIDRIMDAFPPYNQQQIRMQLSTTLQGIVSQQLLPRLDGTGRVAALEILVANTAIRNLIREGKTCQINSIIQTNSKVGMQSMDMALRDLYRSGIVSYEKVLALASDQEMFIQSIIK